MNNEFSILAQFLDSLGPEVSGHSSSPLSEEQKDLIRKFASGQLGSEERDSLLPEILSNERALHALVDRLQTQAG